MRKQKLQVKHNLIFMLSPLVFCFSHFVFLRPPVFFPLLCLARQCCSGKLLKNLFPCEIRTLPCSNMLSVSNQSPYLAFCFFWKSGNLFYPLPSQKKTRECNNVVAFHALLSSQWSVDLWNVYLSGNHLLYSSWLGLAGSSGAVLSGMMPNLDNIAICCSDAVM